MKHVSGRVETCIQACRGAWLEDRCLHIGSWVLDASHCSPRRLLLDFLLTWRQQEALNPRCTPFFAFFEKPAHPYNNKSKQDQNTPFSKPKLTTLSFGYSETVLRRLGEPRIASLIFLFCSAKLSTETDATEMMTPGTIIGFQRVVPFSRHFSTHYQAKTALLLTSTTNFCFNGVFCSFLPLANCIASVTMSL